MFDSLTSKLGDVFRTISGKATLDEANIAEALKAVRNALIDADVAMPVIQKFITTVKQRAIGLKVEKHLKPDQFFIKIVHETLCEIMGGEHSGINLAAQAPVVVLMAGLQGSGKTTSTAKLARMLKDQKKKVMVVSADVYRPAAIDQLKTLASEIEVEFFPADPSEQPLDIAKAALEAAKSKYIDVLFVDTAGRLHIDDAMMGEIQELHQFLQPTETLFVVDAMTGQDAANTAKVFNDTLALTGVILSKTDGDARGGAALSVREITGKPIKYLGVGEKTDALEAFHPERISHRILGMGDMLTLIEEIEQKVDKDKAEKLAKKMAKGKGFDLNDLKSQLEQMKKMGGMASMLDKLPGMGQLPDHVRQQATNTEAFTQMEVIIDSMTKKERKFPQIVNNSGSRKKRIARGAGVDVPAVNKLLKQFDKMQKMMKKMKKLGGIQQLMGKMGGPGGPGGFGGMGGGGFPPFN